MTMRGLTLYQPYATLIAYSCKTIETRTWGTTYRGPIAIHAAKRWDDAVAADCSRAMSVLDGHRWLTSPARKSNWGDTLGKVLAVANLVGCWRILALRPEDHWVGDLDRAFGDFSAGRYGWELADVRPIVPGIPWRGSMGLWNVPEELEMQIREAIRTGG